MGELKGDYVGEIRYIDDPTRSGRCKIRVFSIFDNTPDNELPWFTPVNSGIFSSGGSGSVSIPKVGQIVKVRFHGGDLYSGEYYAIQNLDPELAEEIKDDYENSHVLLFDANQQLFIGYQPSTGIKISLKGTRIILDADGRIIISHKQSGNQIDITERDINIVSTADGVGGTVNITGGQTVNVTADNVHINSDNISLGKDANKHVVVAENLIKVLNEINAQLMLKMPQGPGLTGAPTFDGIKSNIVSIKK